MSREEGVAAGAERAAGEENDTRRLEAFSDGVLAVAITLLIFNVTVPHVGEGELGKALLKQWPSYASYAVSFLIIGIIWVNHHNLFDKIAKVDRGVLFLNIFLLLVVAFLPFPTALLAAYVGGGGANSHISAAVYGATMTLIGLAFIWLWTYLAQHEHLLVPGFTSRDARTSRAGAIVGPIVYGASIFLAFISAPACLALYAAVALYFAIYWRPRRAGAG